MEILLWTPLQVFATHNFLPCSCLHIFFLFMNNVFSHIRINLFSILSFSSFSFHKNTRYPSLPWYASKTPPWDYSPCPMEVGNLSSQSMAPSSFMNQWESRITFSPMEIKMKMFMPNEKLREVPFSNQNRMINLMTNGTGGLILSPILDILMGFLSSIIVTSIHSILTSYFFILTILSS